MPTTPTKETDREWAEPLHIKEQVQSGSEHAGFYMGFFPACNSKNANEVSHETNRLSATSPGSKITRPLWTLHYLIQSRVDYSCNRMKLISSLWIERAGLVSKSALSFPSKRWLQESC